MSSELDELERDVDEAEAEVDEAEAETTPETATETGSETGAETAAETAAAAAALEHALETALEAAAEHEPEAEAAHVSPAEVAPAEVPTVSLSAALGDDEEASEADELPPWLEGAIEAIAFVSTEPLTVARVREQLAAEGEDLPPPVIRKAFKTLAKKWKDSEGERPVARGITLVEVGGGLMFRTAAEQARFLRRIFVAKPQKLSRAALETLSIVAYRQPLTRPQIDEIRGVDSSAAVKALIDKKLIRILGKADDVGRPLLYGTTKTFLEFFGLSSLRDLPTLKEYHELKGEGLAPLLEGEDDGDAEGQEGAPKGISIVRDLFNPEKVGSLVSDETQEESDEALSALEQALGQAVAIAKRTSDPNAASPDDAPGDDEKAASRKGGSEKAANDKAGKKDDEPAADGDDAENADGDEEEDDDVDDATRLAELDEELAAVGVDPDADSEPAPESPDDADEDPLDSEEEAS